MKKPVGSAAHFILIIGHGQGTACCAPTGGDSLSSQYVQKR
jgi:hypothetical protein